VTPAPRDPAPRVRPGGGALRAALIALPLAAACIVSAQGGPPAPTARAVTYPVRTMGTLADVVVVTADSAATAPVARIAHRAFARVDSLMSNWTTTSEVARLNRETPAGPTQVHPDVARVLARALRIGRDTGGAMDITVEPLVRAWGFLGGHPRVPSDAEVAAAFAHVGLAKLAFDSTSATLRFLDPGVRVDLGSIAKGYAVDLAADSLRARGIRNACVNVSGNMQLLGSPPGADRWRIGVRDPRNRMPYFARLHLTEQGIATSANYEQFVAVDGRRYGHIMDPRTGRPADGLLAVTVVAATAVEADGWDTGLFVLGAADAMRIARARSDFSAILVAPGANGVDTVWVESDLERMFVLEPEARERFHVRYF
jgi:thiamine biosynthesis lipoprotein ApbE